MASELKVKVGRVEVEYKGQQDFDVDSIISLARAISAISGTNVDTNDVSVLETANSSILDSSMPSSPTATDLSVNTIAARLGADTSPKLPKLLQGAAIYLTRQGSDRFTRDQLRETMKQATNYFDKNMVSNMSKSLKQLVKANKLRELSNGTYALSAATKEELERRLAD